MGNVSYRDSSEDEQDEISLRRFIISGRQLHEFPVDEFLRVANQLSYLDISSNFFNTIPLIPAASLSSSPSSSLGPSSNSTYETSHSPPRVFTNNSSTSPLKIPRRPNSHRYRTNHSSPSSSSNSSGSPSGTLSSTREVHPSIMRRISQQLSFVNLSNNKFEKLPHFLVYCYSIEEINLSFNAFTSFPSWELKQLEKLKKFYMTNNLLTDINAEVFPNLTRLRIIDMSFNRLSRLPSTISALFMLTDLNISFNNLSALPPAIGKLYSLRILDIRHNQISALPEFISQLQNLRRFSAAGNCISYLPKSLSRMVKLQELNLANNEVSIFPHKIPSSLVALDLRHNLIAHIPENALISNQSVNDQNLSLQSLILFNNQIQFLPTSFIRLSNIIDIEFSYNHIQSLPGNSKNFRYLRDVYLKGNRFHKVPEALCNLPYLENINLSCNRIQFLPLALFTQCPNLRSVRAVLNDMTHLLDKDIPSDASFKTLSLRTLSIAFNKIQELPPNFCRLLGNLKILDAGHNRLSHLPESFGRNATSLSTLILSSNQLSSLSLPYSRLSRIQHLSAANNQIEQNPFPKQKIPESIHTLELAGNSFPVPLLAFGNRKKKQHSTRQNQQNQQNQHGAIHLGNITVEYGTAEMQGRRPTMEDAVMIAAPLSSRHKNICMYGVFDGHGGATASQRCADIFPRALTEVIEEDGYRMDDGFGTDPFKNEQILNRVFLNVDREITSLMKSMGRAREGSTGNIVIVTPHGIAAGNVGDARTVLVIPERNTHEMNPQQEQEYHLPGDNSNGDNTIGSWTDKDRASVYQLSYDHKALNVHELRRIREAGGYVTERGRVQGVLAVSRGFGDLEVKPYVTSMPAVSTVPHPVLLHPNDGITECSESRSDAWVGRAYVIIACDGVWDVTANEHVLRILACERKSKGRSVTCQEAAIALRDYAFACGSGDNITCCVLRLDRDTN